MGRLRWLAVMGAAIATLVFASAPGAQPPTPSPPAPSPTPTPAPGTPPSPTPTPPPKEKPEEEVAPRPEVVIPQERVPEELLPSRTVPTFIGPDLFNPPAHQGFITLTPTFTLSGEYNDNIFLTSQNRKSDEIIGFVPGLTLSLQRPGFRLST